MKKSGTIIAAGVLDIIAGAFCLIVALMLQDFANFINSSLDFMIYLVPIALLLIGIVLCAKKVIKRSDLITFGIVKLLLVIVQFVFGAYVTLGIVQCVLIIISAILCFASKPYYGNE